MIRIRQGPRFNLKIGPALGIIFLACLIVAGFGIAEGEYLYAFFSLVAGFMLIFPVMDIRGIEVNTLNHTVRRYRMFLWFRLGKFRRLDAYRSIYLTRKYITVGTSEYAEHSSETYHYYQIKLVDESGKQQILLAEYRNYYKAREICDFICLSTGMILKDKVKG